MPPAARIYYDGSCGLCHRFVRFVLTRDAGGEAFRFAPIDGETFRARIPEDRRPLLPDSVLVDAGDGALLARSDGVIAVLRRLPSPWPRVGRLLGGLPRPLRDLGYDAVAKLRRRLFPRPSESCPVGDPELRSRFDP